MAELKNARHELFSALVAFGKAKGGEAYLQAGYKCSASTARKHAARLMTKEDIRSRVKELQAGRVQELGYTTNDVISWLGAIADSHLGQIFSWTVNKKTGEVRLTVRPSKEIPEQVMRAIKSFKMGPNGPEIVMHDKNMAARLIGMHRGMFQGESADTPIATVTNIQNNTVFVDAPRRETVEEWQARVDRERAPKQIEQKVAS